MCRHVTVCVLCPRQVDAIQHYSREESRLSRQVEIEKAAASGRPGVVTVDEVRRIYQASRGQFESELPRRVAA